MKCNTCGKGWPVVRVDIYWGQHGAIQLCDDCLDAELRTEGAEVVVSNSWYVAPNGAEYELPSYAS